MRLEKDTIKSIFDEAIKHKSVYTTDFKSDLVKSDFTLNLGALTPWTAAEGQTLLSLAVLGAPTRKLISSQTGVKYIEELKYLDTVSGIVPFSNGFNPVGATTLTVKNVSVAKMQSQEVFYPEDLNNYSTQLSLMPGYNTQLPFEQLYAELKSKYIQRDIEFLDWGTQTGGTAAGCVWTGLGSHIPLNVAATGCTYTSFDWAKFVAGTTQTTGTTQSLYLDLTGIQGTMVNKLPEAIQGEKLTWFVAPAVFRKMLAVLRDGPTGTGNFHIDVTLNNGTQSFAFPAYTNLEVVSTPGLSSENPAAWVATLITPAWNLVGLSDLMSEWEKFSIIWNPYEEKGQFSCHFKCGIDCYFFKYITYSA